MKRSLLLAPIPFLSLRSLLPSVSVRSLPVGLW